jgi:hypothetical protein
LSRLEKQLDELERQYRELSRILKGHPSSKPSKPSGHKPAR